MCNNALDKADAPRVLTLRERVLQPLCQAVGARARHMTADDVVDIVSPILQTLEAMDCRTLDKKEAEERACARQEARCAEECTTTNVLRVDRLIVYNALKRLCDPRTNVRFEVGDTAQRIVRLRSHTDDTLALCEVVGAGPQDALDCDAYTAARLIAFALNHLRESVCRCGVVCDEGPE